MSADETTQAREVVKPENINDHSSTSFWYRIWRFIIFRPTDVNSLADITSCLHCSEQHYSLMFLSLRLFEFFVLFNDAWSQNGHSASNTTSYTHIKLFITSIIITYYHHFHYHILTFISITNLLYFLIQVCFFEEGKNMFLMHHALPLLILKHITDTYICHFKGCKITGF